MKVLKGGIYDLYPKPEAGKKVKCPCCGAELEITEDEPSAVPDFNNKDGLGHSLQCPECKRKVYVALSEDKQATIKIDIPRSVH